jgi:hypothetical protein
MPWNPDQVLALAPDPSSAKSGGDLAVPRKWKSLGATAACAWGTIQGSGKEPYRTCLDAGGPAFKCTCPSRKFPCKHGLGLFLILAREPSALTENDPPAWTAEWLAKRLEKVERQAAKTDEPASPPDPEAELKAARAAEARAAARENKVTAGLDDLGVWIKDLVRSGFATLPGRPSSFWETPAARLVDAQAPGLARRVRALDGITATGEDWPARLLHQISLLHLALEGWSRADSLPPATRADLRATVGFTTDQEELIAQPGVSDRWLVLGQCVEQEDRLRVQRAWLWGLDSRRFALNLSFSAAPNQPLDISLVPDVILDAELVFFPGAWPLRALVKRKSNASVSRPVALPHESVSRAYASAAEAFTTNPWLERVPFALDAVTPVRRAQGWIVRDQAGGYVPLRIADSKAWRLVSFAGGHPVALAGEWDGERLGPLGAWREERFLRI